MPTLHYRQTLQSFRFLCFNFVFLLSRHEIIATMTSINHNHYRPHHQHHMTKFLFLCTFLFANIFPSCKCSSNSSKLGVHMIRSPESTIAPLRDEVLFECELNLNPDRLEWRFRSSDSNGIVDDYLYLKKNVIDGFRVTPLGRTSMYCKCIATHPVTFIKEIFFLEFSQRSKALMSYIMFFPLL